MFAALLAATGCRGFHPAEYPIGLFGVRDTNDLVIARAAGFSLVQGRAETGYLAAARAEGLGVLAVPATQAGESFDARKARSAVRKFDSHPALWGWYVADEPDLHFTFPSEIRKAHRVVRSAGRKPTALVLYQGHEALAYAHLTDILMVDRYPIPWLPLANVPQHLRQARLALGPHKPLIAVLQAFDWSHHPDLLSDPTPKRPPTLTELRAMAYAALVERADGLFFYAYNDGRWQMTEHPATWHALCRVVGEVRRREPLFRGRHLIWPRDHRYDDPAQRYNAALLSSIGAALLHVSHGNATVPAGHYVVAVNTTDQPLGYAFSLPWLFENPVPVLGENRALKPEDGWLHDRFEPYAARVYGPIPPPMVSGQTR
ncbi:MAG TPA: hypothetical protein PKM73_00805 [Verrucomicrobiota bacterium]|nr:hypothetical protein [Verrucomicrobiota bacterium]HNU49882.1 hypothetical protein [Verrucomicrobiota bacterium]